MHNINIWHLLTFLMAFFYLIYLLFRAYPLLREYKQHEAIIREKNTIGSLTVWGGMVFVATGMMLSDLNSKVDALVALSGFGIIVYGFYLNHRNAKLKL